MSTVAKFANNVLSDGFNFLKRITADTRQHMQIGVLHGIGFDPKSKVGTETTWGWGGMRWNTTDSDATPRYVPGSGGEGGILWNVMETGLFGVGIGAAFMSDGLGGALRQGIWEAAHQGAMARHAYGAMADGTMHMGKSVLARKFAKGSFMRGALNTSDYIARYAGGAIAGYAASQLLGGGILASLVAPMAATAGVRAGGRLTGPAILLGATALTGYAAAKATAGVLKAGYNHAQMKKSIQTSGDLAAFGTYGAHTMRQRAVMSIAKSQMNARSALGQEASYLSYPSRSYTSRYRQY
jgi:hypothetical protein